MRRVSFAGARCRCEPCSGRHAIVVGEVVEHEAPTRFAHTHRFTQHDDPYCTVVYDLKKVDGGVEVTLSVENIPVGTKTETEMRRGGDFILKNLKAIVETGRPPLGTRTHVRDVRSAGVRAAGKNQIRELAAEIGGRTIRIHWKERAMKVLKGIALGALALVLLAPAGGAMRVAWSNEGEVGANPLMRWFVAFMDRMMGPDFEAGLADLTTLAEKP